MKKKRARSSRNLNQSSQSQNASKPSNGVTRSKVQDRLAISVRIPSETHVQYSRFAARLGVSLSALCAMALYDYVNART